MPVLRTAVLELENRSAAAVLIEASASVAVYRPERQRLDLTEPISANRSLFKHNTRVEHEI